MPESSAPTIDSAEPIEAEPPRKQAPSVTAAPRPGKRSFAWWSLLIAYLVLFGVTGYLAFGTHPAASSLNANLAATAASITDESTRKVFLDAVTEEARLLDKRAGLAFHSFNIVLGALLGFLAASAVSAANNDRK